MDLTEKRLESCYVYRGKVLNMRVDTVELPGGRRGTREVVEYAGAVAVVALDRDGRVLLVRQYRYPVGRELIEIPAGKLEPGEDPAAAARRELAEETGSTAGRLERLLRFFSTPGFTSEEMHLYLATDLEPGPAAPDEDEFVELVRVPLDTARRMVERGEICDAKSIVGILTVCDRLQDR
ncbi:MAG: NUDIX hydrolase [Bacillota bacterium]|nr:NUDIX hydrolase [Bacillota bacterium]